jgi:hypothetical protein
VNILSSSRTNRLARGIAISFLSFIAVLGIAMPASADSVGEEYEAAILGNEIGRAHV